MTIDISVSIANFSDHFECELEKIGTLRVRFRGGIDHSSSSRVYQKILYAAILDALSRAAFPGTKKRQQRVLAFIDTYTGWSDRNRISSPQLYLHLRSTRKNAGLLYADIKKRISKWAEGETIPPDSDPNLNETMKLAATQKEREAIEKTRYAACFYIYRNHLVHEFREPGYGIEDNDRGDSAPYYHSMTSCHHGSKDNSWELVFPCGLFRDLCRNGLRALVKDLTKSGRSPHASFEFGTLWQR